MRVLDTFSKYIAITKEMKEDIVLTDNLINSKVKSPFHPNFKYTGREPDMSKQPARSYIKDNTEPKYAKKLLKGVETYIKYIAKVNCNEFTVCDLASNLNEIAKQRGVGTASISALEQQLKADGWL